MSLGSVPALQRLSCGTQLGMALASGDVNADGKSDIVVGAPGGATGTACLVLGNSLLDIRTPVSRLLGDTGSRVGSSLLLANFNSTPKADLLVGGPGFSSGRGAVHAVDGEKLPSFVASDAFKYLGGAIGDDTGAALAGGDLTGDGVSDLAVGAPLSEYNGGTPGTPANSGIVYVVKNTGASITNTTLYTNTPNSNIFRIQNLTPVISATDLRAGTALAVADLNGDGQGDLVVGVPGYDDGNVTDTGAVFVFYGPLTGNRSLGNADARLVGASAGALAGSSLARVKGAGRDALLVGAPGSGPTQAGHAYLVAGPLPAGTSSLSSHKSMDGQAGDLAGTSVASGDFDDDGVADLLIGAPGAGGNKGAAYLIYGNQTLMPTNALSAYTSFEGELAGDQAGRSVAGAGDFDGDGVEDILVGAPGHSGGQGQVYLVRGQGPSAWYPDLDGDGHGDMNALPEMDCMPPGPGWVKTADDCNDNNQKINPGVAELCSTVGVDDNCDGKTDDGTSSDAPLWFKDTDQDLHADIFTSMAQSCSAPGSGWSRYEELQGEECYTPDSDNDPGTHQHAQETCDLKDNDCNDQVDDGDAIVWYVDVDGDGFGSDKEFFPYHAGCASIPRPGYVANKLDCNDRDKSLNPNTPWYKDNDGDGVGNSTEPAVLSCTKPDGAYVRSGNDCNDQDNTVRPGIAEVCEDENGPQKDNNCNGTPDDTLAAATWFQDNDGDGYGSNVQLGRFCGKPNNSSKLTGDCNDAQPVSYPTNTEVCEVNPSDPYAYVEQIDNNCVNGVDDTAQARWWDGDGDRDGFRGTTFGLSRCTNPSDDIPANVGKVRGKYLLDDAPVDCNDADSSATTVKMWYPDTDNDKCGNPDKGVSSCYNPSNVCGGGVSYVNVSRPGCI